MERPFSPFKNFIKGFPKAFQGRKNMWNANAKFNLRLFSYFAAYLTK